MTYCHSCGAPIPDKQKFCSMCVGDPWLSDGYLMREIERQDEEERKRQEEEDTHR